MKTSNVVSISSGDLDFTPSLGVTQTHAIRWSASAQREIRSEVLAVEEPLEITVEYTRDGAPMSSTIAVTMRTPGQDADLALGYLITEGVLRSVTDVETIHVCGTPNASGVFNRIRVVLRPHIKVDIDFWARATYVNSSCGICGKTSLEAIQQLGCVAFPRLDGLYSAKLIQRLPAALHCSQDLFATTGGLHAAGVFDAAGNTLMIREDIGRHNAVDKLIGACAEQGIRLQETMLLVSGRASFELMQKALMAGIPALIAVGAPSSLALLAAQEFDMTLIGFLREQTFNIYHGDWRVRL